MFTGETQTLARPGKRQRNLGSRCKSLPGQQTERGKGREAGGKGRLNAQSCKDIKKTSKDNDATYKQLLTDFFN